MCASYSLFLFLSIPLTHTHFVVICFALVYCKRSSPFFRFFARHFVSQASLTCITLCVLSFFISIYPFHSIGIALVILSFVYTFVHFSRSFWIIHHMNCVSLCIYFTIFFFTIFLFLLCLNWTFDFAYEREQYWLYTKVSRRYAHRWKNDADKKKRERTRDINSLGRLLLTRKKCNL